MLATSDDGGGERKGIGIEKVIARREGERTTGVVRFRDGIRFLFTYEARDGFVVFHRPVPHPRGRDTIVMARVSSPQRAKAVREYLETTRSEKRGPAATNADLPNGDGHLPEKS
jgi:hypothetical protein